MPLPGTRMRWLAVPFVLIAVAATGCHRTGQGQLAGTASDEWTRTYPWQPGGVVDISNRNGSVEIEGGDGATIEVHVERVARAQTDAGAQELLPRITIEEEATAGGLTLVTEGIEGMLIGVAYEVRYRVRAPRDAAVRVRVVNGNLTVRDFAGSVVLSSTNGSLTAESLSGGVEARGVNGKVSISLRSVGDDMVDVRSTNGGIDLAVPAGANATLLASATNGNVDVTGVTLDPVGEQTRRRVRGRLNGGGTPIEASTVNGSVRVISHP